MFITQITPPVVTVVSPTDEKFVLNEYEWMHLRTEIKKTKTIGWSWETPTGLRIDIDHNGRVPEYPSQFNFMDDCLTVLLEW